MKIPICITGVWLVGVSETDVEVRVEVNGKWKTLGREHVPIVKGESQTVSHIWESSGIRNAKETEL